MPEFVCRLGSPDGSVLECFLRLDRHVAAVAGRKRAAGEHIEYLIAIHDSCSSRAAR